METAASRAPRRARTSPAKARAARAGSAAGAAAAPDSVAAPASQDSERMSRVDTAWLRMDTPHNLMMIMGLWLLEPGIGIAPLRARVEERLLRYRRFRQKVVEDALGARWVLDPDFDLHRHVVCEPLVPAAGQSARQALSQRVAALAVMPLDPDRPLWQLHLVEHYDDVDGRPGSVLIARVHHCIADGMALIAVMLSITDGGRQPPEPEPAPALDDDREGWGDALLKPLADIASKAMHWYGDGVAKSVEMMSKPPQQLFGSIELATTGAQVLKDVGALALMDDDAPTRLKGHPGLSKRVAWCEPISLEQVRVVGKALGASINDVALACVAGAIGRYLRDKGDDPTGQEIRAMVPVNLRPIEKAHELGNRFGLVPLVLPVGIANPVARVYAVRQRMNELKGSYQPVLAFGVLAIAGLLIKPVQHSLLNLFARKATAVMTNVPGPREALSFCGSTLRQIMFWVPQSGDIGMGVSILSYGGGVQFGLITDAGLCPDPEAIIGGFEPEFQQLLTLTLMLPWGPPD